MTNNRSPAEEVANLPESVIRLPGMTTPGEREYLFRFARDHFTGQGAILDLGSWLGSLVAAMAEGLKQNTKIDRSRVKIEAFDNFRFYPWMVREFVANNLPIPSREDESFLPLFLQLMQPWRELVNAHEQDLTKPIWTPEPIELLVVDVMKSWELANAVYRTFYPYLVPGLSTVLHQDFAHFATPWIILTSYRLREYFEHVDGVARSGSVVFKLKNAIPPAKLATPVSLSDFSEQEIADAFAWGLSLAPEGQRGDVIAARVILMVEDCQLRSAALPMRDLLSNPEVSQELRHRVASAWVDRHPGFGRAETRRFYLDLGEQRLPGQGAWVTTGDWLGSIAACLAEGISRRPLRAAEKALIHWFDDSRYQSWMDPTLKGQKVACTEQGLAQLSREVLIPWQRLIHGHQGDQLKLPWQGPNIELLVLDDATTWESLSSVVARLVPALAVGKSWLIHNLYAVSSTPRFLVWIHRVREFVELDRDLTKGEIFAFKLSRAIPKEICDAKISAANVTAEEIRAAFAWANTLVPTEHRPQLRLAELELLIAEGKLASAGPLAREMIQDPELASSSRERVADDWLLSLPGRIDSESRRQLCEWARTTAEQLRSTLVLGDWLGWISTCLAEGIRRRGLANTKVQSIHWVDIDGAQPWMKETLARLDFPFTDAGKLSAMRAAIEPWRDQLSVVTAFDTSFSVPAIDLLFLDGTITTGQFAVLAQKVLPNLSAERGRIVVGNDQRENLLRILLWLFAFREEIEHESNPPIHQAISFRVLRPVIRDSKAKSIELANLSRQEIESAYAWICEQLPKWQAKDIVESLIKVFIEEGNFNLATVFVERLISEQPFADESASISFRAGDTSSLVRIVFWLYRFRDFVAREPASTADGVMSFRVRRAKDQELLSPVISPKAYSRHDMELAYAWICEQLPAESQKNLLEHLVKMLVTGGYFAQASVLVEKTFKTEPADSEWCRSLADFWLLHHPSCSHDPAKLLLADFANTMLKGTGKILVLGDWLGNHAACLAEGLRRQGKKDARIRLRERAQPAEWARSTFTHLHTELTETGHRRLIEELVAPWKDSIDIEFKVPENIKGSAGPIELLLIDCGDTWDFGETLVQDLAPALIPGKSFILIPRQSGVAKPWTTRFLDRFDEYLHELPFPKDEPGFVLYRVEKALPSSWDRSRPEEHDIADDSLESVVTRLDRKKRTGVDTLLAKLVIQIYRKTFRSALDAMKVMEEFDRVRPSDFSELAELWLRHFLHEVPAGKLISLWQQLVVRGVKANDAVLVVGSPAHSFVFCWTRSEDAGNVPVCCLPVGPSEGTDRQDTPSTWNAFLSEIDRRKIALPELSRIFRRVDRINNSPRPVKILVLDVSVRDHWPASGDLVDLLLPGESHLVLTRSILRTVMPVAKDQSPWTLEFDEANTQLYSLGRASKEEIVAGLGKILDSLATT